MQNSSKIIVAIITFILSGTCGLCFAQANSKNNKDTLTRAEIGNEVEKIFNKKRSNFYTLDSTLTFNGVLFGSELVSVNEILKIQNIRTDSKMITHKFGIIGNKDICKIDTFSLIGFADFIDNKLVQLSFESFNKYRNVASYFIKHFGIPHQYSDDSIIWVGNNVKMIVTDNSKVKDQNSVIGNTAISINFLNY